MIEIKYTTLEFENKEGNNWNSILHSTAKLEFSNCFFFLSDCVCVYAVFFLGLHPSSFICAAASY